jgi:hypothetical protein
MTNPVKVMEGHALGVGINCLAIGLF